ncbi:MAG: OmpH family outer membrane protein [Xanthomonadaceae bacterium]|nr:OmpH family outer membrane protein [Xanthomonadaceae bacterium]
MTRVMMGMIGLMLAVSASASEVKFGIVDMQKALQSVDAGKKAKTELEAEFNKKKTELQNEEASIKKLHEEFQKQSLVMNDQAKAKKQSELQERIMKFQEKTARSQTDIQKKEQELTLPIVTALKKIVHGIATERQMALVLENNENTILFSLDKDDITTEVINQYNKTAKK